MISHVRLTAQRRGIDNVSDTGGNKQEATRRETVWYLRRYVEPREGAFTILKPEGWSFEGGVVRLNPASGP